MKLASRGFEKPSSSLMQKEINKKVASSLGSKGRRAQHDKRHAAGEAGFEEDSSSLTQKDIDKKVPSSLGRKGRRAQHDKRHAGDIRAKCRPWG